MTTQHLRKYCKIDRTKTVEVENTMRNNHLSARAYDRILKVSRTIADLAGSERLVLIILPKQFDIDVQIKRGGDKAYNKKELMTKVMDQNTIDR